VGSYQESVKGDDPSGKPSANLKGQKRKKSDRNTSEPNTKNSHQHHRQQEGSQQVQKKTIEKPLWRMVREKGRGPKAKSTLKKKSSKSCMDTAAERVVPTGTGRWEKKASGRRCKLSQRKGGLKKKKGGVGPTTNERVYEIL